MTPEHLSKEQDIALKPGDRVRVQTPGGGGYGNALKRDVHAVAEDVRLGRYSVAEAKTEFGVVLTPELRVDVERTDIDRAERSSA
jgi:N-methylhydantoinase B